jgi:hypothetical protein
MNFIATACVQRHKGKSILCCQARNQPLAEVGASDMLIGAASAAGSFHRPLPAVLTCCVPMSPVRPTADVLLHGPERSEGLVSCNVRLATDSHDSSRDHRSESSADLRNERKQIG